MTNKQKLINFNQTIQTLRGSLAIQEGRRAALLEEMLNDEEITQKALDAILSDLEG